MYFDELLTVGKVENGYIIQVRVPYKEDDAGISCSPSMEKKFYVATAEEIGKKVAELLPALEDKMDAEAAFEKSFKEAADND